MLHVVLLGNFLGVDDLVCVEVGEAPIFLTLLIVALAAWTEHLSEVEIEGRALINELLHFRGVLVVGILLAAIEGRFAHSWSY